MKINLLCHMQQGHEIHSAFCISMVYYYSIQATCTGRSAEILCVDFTHSSCVSFSANATCAFYRLKRNSATKKKLQKSLGSNLWAALTNMTDVPECRRRTAWRAWWLWRCLYTLNDMQQMKGKCDWTAFPPGLNIKASPTGNIVNLPRLPPQWGTRSTMRKNGPSARCPSRDKHICAQTKSAQMCFPKFACIQTHGLVLNTWIAFTVNSAFLIFFSIFSPQKTPRLNPSGL